MMEIPDRVTVNRDDLRSLLDTYDRPADAVTRRLSAALDGEGTR